MAKTWAQEEMERLDAMRANGEDWTVEDWETYFYIQNVNAESDYYNSLD